MEPATFPLLILALFWAPALHVAFARGGGPWRPPPGTRCPFGPRAGWLVIVLTLGPIGWLMYLGARRRRARAAADPPGRSPGGAIS